MGIISARSSPLATPVAQERGELAIATGIAISLYLRKQRFGSPAIVLRTERVGLECPFQRFVKVAELFWNVAPPVDRHHRLRRPHPLAYRVARQTHALRYFVQRQFVAYVHPSYLAYHFHGDHPFSPAQILSKFSGTPGSVFSQQIRL